MDNFSYSGSYMANSQLIELSYIFYQSKKPQDIKKVESIMIGCLDNHNHSIGQISSLSKTFITSEMSLNQLFEVAKEESLSNQKNQLKKS